MELKVTLKRDLLFMFILVSALLLSGSLPAKQKSKGITGEALFEKHCATCHPDGGNRLNPERTLHRKDLKANGFNTPEDIVRKMRNPGAFSPHAGNWSAMKTFDKKTLPDEEAHRIAEYILKTFR
jgi:cytochrome c6